MKAESIIKPKRPAGHKGWSRAELPFNFNMGFPIEGWFHSETGIQVLSAVEVVRDPGTVDLGPEYHLSISKNGGRCDSSEALWVLGQFDLTDAKEDNHTPHGIARNFWRPVADNLSGYECACKDEEPAIVEDKGDYVWRGVTV